MDEGRTLPIQALRWLIITILLPWEQCVLFLTSAGFFLLIMKGGIYLISLLEVAIKALLYSLIERKVHMSKSIIHDYNQHYETTLAKKEDLHKIKAADFMSYFSNLIIKYANKLEEKVGNNDGSI